MSVTLFPVPIDERLIQNMIETNRTQHNNFIPFTAIYTSLTQGYNLGSFRDIVGNIVLLFPLGFYLPLIKPKLKKFKYLFIIGFFSSLGIESLQLLISNIIGMTYRSFVVDDIILNTIGIVFGYLLFKLISPILNRLANSIKDNRQQDKKLINLGGNKS